MMKTYDIEHRWVETIGRLTRIGIRESSTVTRELLGNYVRIGNGDTGRRVRYRVDTVKTTPDGGSVLHARFAPEKS